MIFYQLDFVVVEVLKNMPTDEQQKLKQFTGAEFSKKEAAYVWNRVQDHKWFVGERLKRDVGLRVAAIDFIENFYEPQSSYKNKSNRSGFFGKVLHPLSQFMRIYFVAKSFNVPH